MKTQVFLPYSDTKLNLGELIKTLNSLVLLLFTLLNLSCTKDNNLNRSVASEGKVDQDCFEVIKQFRTFKEYGVPNKYAKYDKFNDPLTFNNYEKKYLRQIKSWAESGSRKNTLAQMRHNGAFSRVSTAFKVDTPFGIVRQLSSLFAEVESSFYIAKRAHKQSEDLRTILKKVQLSPSGLSQSLRKEIAFVSKATMLEKSALGFVLNNGDKSKEIERALVKDISRLNELFIDNAYNIQIHIDEYSVMRDFIRKSQSPKKEEVLEKLELKNILQSCEICGDVDSLSRPSLKSIEGMLKDIKVVRIMYLKRQLFLERWITVASRLPTQTVYRIIDKTLESIPMLNSSAFRKWLRVSFIDFKDRYKYFPRIDRIIFSKSSPAQVVKIVNEYFAIDGPDFLITMARRTDAQDSWNTLFNWLKENKPQDNRDHLSVLYDSMNDARDEAVKRGAMPEWHHPNNSYKARFVVDLFMYTASGYVSYYYFGEMISKYLDRILPGEEEIIDALDKELEENPSSQKIIIESSRQRGF